MVLARMRITNGTRLQPRQPFPTSEFAVSDQHLNSSEGHDAQQCFEKVLALLGNAIASFTQVIPDQRNANPSDARSEGEDVDAGLAEGMLGAI